MRARDRACPVELVEFLLSREHPVGDKFDADRPGGDHDRHPAKA